MISALSKTLILVVVFNFVTTTQAADAKYDCEVKVDACATSWKDDITSAMKSFDFKNACSYYKGVVSCLHEQAAHDNNCKPYNYPVAFKEAKIKAHDYTKGMCGPDGSMSSCAYDFKKCADLASQIRSTLKKKQHDTSCQIYTKLDQCASLVKKRMVCPIEMETHLLTLVKDTEKALIEVCFYTCDIGIELCTESVPSNLTGGMKMTEEYQENLCASFESAKTCMKTDKVKKVCNDENKSSQLTDAISKHDGYYDEFCSEPARTCTMEMRSCLLAAEDKVAWNNFESVQDVQQFCSEVNDTINCIKDTSRSQYCQGKDGAKRLADVLYNQRQLVDKYCGTGQCIFAFPDCYDHVKTLKSQIYDGNEKASCMDVERAINCTHQMETFEPCLSLEFDNFTFSNAQVFLSDYTYTHCGPGQCITEFPDCHNIFTSVWRQAQNGDQNVTCINTEIAVNCSHQMREFEPCQQLMFDDATFSEAAVQVKNFTFWECGAGQCISFYPECYTSVKDVTTQMMDPTHAFNISCNSIQQAQNCSDRMKTFEPCLTMEFDSVGFQNATKFISEYYELECVLTCDKYIGKCTNEKSPVYTPDTEQETLCNSLYVAEQCLNSTDVKTMCEDENKLPDWERAISCQRDDCNHICYVPQCKHTWADCYRLIDKVIYQYDKGWGDELSCSAVHMALVCAEDMAITTSCNKLGFLHTITDVSLALAERCDRAKEYRLPKRVQESQEYKTSKKKEENIIRQECKQIFPECFDQVVYPETPINTCRNAKVRRKCAKDMGISLACRQSELSQLFTDVEERAAKYVDKHCQTKDSNTNSASSHIPYPKIFLTFLFLVIKYSLTRMS